MRTRSTSRTGAHCSPQTSTRLVSCWLVLACSLGLSHIADATRWGSSKAPRSIMLLGAAGVMFAGSVWSVLGPEITSGQFLSIPAVLVVLVLLALVATAIVSLSGKLPALEGFERTSSSVGAVVAGLFLLSYAVLSVVRGTFFNNIWWVITVTMMSVALGLAIAALAEKAGSTENIAKSFIFMPMAISFVGASIVWRLQYQPRFPATETQTSVMNAAWVELGRLSFSSWPRILVMLVLFGLLAFLVKSAVSRAMVGLTFSAQMIGIVASGFLLFKLADRSLGGFKETAEGTYAGPDVVRFLQDAPFNNVSVSYTHLTLPTILLV